MKWLVRAFSLTSCCPPIWPPCAWTMNREVHGQTVTHNSVKRCLHKWILISVEQYRSSHVGGQHDVKWKRSRGKKHPLIWLTLVNRSIGREIDYQYCVIHSESYGVKITPQVLMEDYTMHFTPVLNLRCYFNTQCCYSNTFGCYFNTLWCYVQTLGCNFNTWGCGPLLMDHLKVIPSTRDSLFSQLEWMPAFALWVAISLITAQYATGQRTNSFAALTSKEMFELSK